MATSGSIGTRLAEFAKSLVGSDRGWQVRFAAKLKVPPSTVNAYVRNMVRPGIDMQEKLRVLDCDIEWLMTGKSPQTTRDDPRILQLDTIPLIGKIVADPGGKQYFEDFEGITIPFRRGPYFALVVENDSLINAPEGDHSFEIYPGDICIFESGRQPKNGDIVAVELKQGDGRMVKILRHLPKDELELASANKFRNYPSVLVKKSQVSSFGILVGKQKLSKGEMERIGIK